MKARPCTALALLLSLAACTIPDGQPPPEGEVELALVFIDAATGKPVPARVELLNTSEEGQIARDALPILCKRVRPWPVPAIEETFEFCRGFRNPQTGTDQFYSIGRSHLSLPPGDYHLRVWKGLEYRRFEAWLHLDAGRPAEIEIELTRWIDMPRREWFSADDHLHLPRPTRDSNGFLSRWMAAEDIHVANLLQMGTPDRFDFAPQYAHGEEGHHGHGHRFLISGQENPRTHFLGHMVILGTESPIHYPDEYLNLRKFFEEGHRQGALNGVGHFGRHGGAQFGLGLVLPHDLLDFMEVLQFEMGQYELWYKVLNTGFRLAPTAGTDYPWGDSYPGRERFYTKVLGGFTVEKWKRAVRAGYTFVTNGPMLDFRVDGKRMGSALRLPAPGEVDVVARAFFDPGSDKVSELELIENGVVVRSFPVERPAAVRIEARFRHRVRRSGWLAIRASGLKHGEPAVRQSLAHSAAVYLSVDGTTPLAETEEARRLARSWVVLLDDLERSLSEENIEQLALRPASAQVDVETIRRNRPGLLEEIRLARVHFEKRSK